MSSSEGGRPPLMDRGEGWVDFFHKYMAWAGGEMTNDPESQQRGGMTTQDRGEVSEQEAEPCPFCGRCVEPDVETASNGQDTMWVFCGECGAEGPTAQTHDAAVEAWNQRRQPERDLLLSRLQEAERMCETMRAKVAAYDELDEDYRAVYKEMCERGARLQAIGAAKGTAMTGAGVRPRTR